MLAEPISWGHSYDSKVALGVHARHDFTIVYNDLSGARLSVFLRCPPAVTRYRSLSPFAGT